MGRARRRGICPLLRLGQRLALQALEPRGAVEPLVFLGVFLGAALDGVSDRGAHAPAGVEHTLDRLPLFEGRVLLVELAELFLESVHIGLAVVGLEESPDFSFPGGDFCTSFLDVHNCTSINFCVGRSLVRQSYKFLPPPGLLQSRELFPVLLREKAPRRNRRLLIGGNIHRRNVV